MKFKKMKNLLVYYGFPSSYRAMYNNDDIVSDIAGKYDIWVCGDSYEKPTHPDYANTTYIISKLETLGVRVFGYVPIGGSLGVNRTLQEQKDAVDDWRNLGVRTIF